MTARSSLIANSCALILILVFCSVSAAQKKSESNPEKEDPKSRSFDFHYGATITDVKPGSTVKIWYPIAFSNQHQDVSTTSATGPSNLTINTEPRFGNKIGYYESKSVGQPISFSTHYTATRKIAGTSKPATLSKKDQARFLEPFRMVPIEGKPLQLLENVMFSDKPMEVGRSLYNIVEQHLKYDKSNPGYGNGDVAWACDSRTGNCTDFHSVFNSLARSRQLPAKFEIGFPIPSDKKQGKIAGYHCWAWFHIQGEGWIPVDISEADKHPEMKEFYFGNLTKDRLSFTIGRDITLIPASENGPLNYFVYPYVEVDGKVWPKEKIQLDFQFKETK